MCGSVADSDSISITVVKISSFDNVPGSTLPRDEQCGPQGSCHQVSLNSCLLDRYECDQLFGSQSDFKPFPDPCSHRYGWQLLDIQIENRIKVNTYCTITVGIHGLWQIPITYLGRYLPVNDKVHTCKDTYLLCFGITYRYLISLSISPQIRIRISQALYFCTLCAACTAAWPSSRKESSEPSTWTTVNLFSVSLSRSKFQPMHFSKDFEKSCYEGCVSYLCSTLLPTVFYRN